MPENRFRRLLDGLTQGVVTLDANGALLYANAAARAALHLSPGTLSELEFQCFDENGRELLGEELPSRRAMATGAPVCGATLYVVQSRTGDDWWLNVTVIPDQRSEPRRCHVIFEDVSERRDIEHERQILFDALALVTAPHSESELIGEISRRMKEWGRCEVAGVALLAEPGHRSSPWRAHAGLGGLRAPCGAGPTSGCLCGQVFDRSTASDQGNVTVLGTFWSSSLESSGCAEPSCEFLSKKSVALIPLRAVSRTYGLLYLADGRPGRFDARKVDLFERLAADVALGLAQRLSDQALHKAEARWQAALEGAGDGIWDCDCENGELYVSRQWKAILGYGDEDPPWTVSDWVAAVHPDHRAGVLKLVGDHLAGRTSSYRAEYRMRAKDGSHRWVLARGRVIERATDGRAVRFVGAHSDITQQREAEDALRQMDERYRAVLREQTDLIARLAPDGAFTFVNEAFCRFLQLPCESIIGKPWNERIEPNSRAEVVAAVDALTPAHPETVSDVQLLRPDGSPCWVQFVIRKIFDQDGRFVEIQGVGRDIDGKRRAELELARKSLELDRYFEHSMDLLFIVDAEGRFRRANPEWERALGVPVAELMRGSVFDLLHPDDVALTREAFLGFSAEQTTAAIVNRYRTRGGSYRYIEWRAYPVGDLIYGAGRDITEHRHAEQALRDSERWLRESQRVSRIGTYALDIGSGLWKASETLEDIFGIGADDPHDVEGWLTLIHPDHRDDMSHYLFEQVLGARLPFNREYMIRRRSDGRTIWVLGRGMLYCGPDGRPTSMVGTIQDITERKAMEEQLLQAQKMESIGRLAGGVAHDFNNLLTVINGYSEIVLLRLPPDDPLRRSVSEIRRAGERAVSLTSQLLAFSRRGIVQPRVLDLNAVIADTERMLRRLLSEDIRLEIRLDPDLWPINADMGQINQVVMNLSVNAKDAMPDGGILEIRTANAAWAEVQQRGVRVEPGDFVELTVRDNGVGIDEQARRHIFEPFFTTKPPGSGTGLGLSTVYGIVNQAGGAVTVDSQPGQGATFRILLPRVAREASGAGAAGPGEGAIRGHETILVAEDQAEVLQFAVTLLEELGYRVLKASNGRDALAVAADHSGPIDCLLTDVVMPGMQGWTLASQLRALRPAVGVVFMSGYTENAMVQNAQAEHGAVFVAKPFTSATLGGGIRRAIAISSRRPG
ncbi:MAG: PAS domain S-box protein [Acidobacteria bacterium]|nr:PAS domain S-box protein [Acidobacteriota bacterium]